MSAVFPESIKPPNVTFHNCNVLVSLPFHDKTFDFVYMRSLMVAFRRKEWGQVFAEVFRVLKPGGYLQCVEAELASVTADPDAKVYMQQSMMVSNSLEVVRVFRRTVI